MFEEILELVKNTAYKPELTNCLLPFAEVSEKLHNNYFDIICEQPLLLIERHEAFNKLYYYLKVSDERVSEDTLLLLDEYDKPLYADNTCRGAFDYNTPIYKQLGFSWYRTYLRKGVINKNLKIRRMMEPEYAKKEDAENIYIMLVNQFDIMADHIPTRTELIEMINGNQVLIIKVNGLLAGALLFEDTGKKSYARALCVSPEFQNSFVGYSLLADYFLRHQDNTRVFELWVDEANEGVRKLHDWFGYKPDGLKNYIFRRN